MARIKSYYARFPRPWQLAWARAVMPRLLRRYITTFIGTARREDFYHKFRRGVEMSFRSQCRRTPSLTDPDYIWDHIVIVSKDDPRCEIRHPCLRVSTPRI
jgi:hypothetical protein